LYGKSAFKNVPATKPLRYEVAQNITGLDNNNCLSSNSLPENRILKKLDYINITPNNY
jgi:hypothetical protein